jgi:hypothetical protein
MAAVMEGGRGSCAALCILYWEVGSGFATLTGCLGLSGCCTICSAVRHRLCHAHPLCLQHPPARCKPGLCIALWVPAVVTCALSPAAVKQLTHMWVCVNCPVYRSAAVWGYRWLLAAWRAAAIA